MGTKVLVQMHDYLGITVGGETMPLLCQFLPQPLIIVDLTVKHYPDCAILIAERLMAPSHINDRQAALPKRHAIGAIDAFVIRAAMPQCLQHVAQPRFLTGMQAHLSSNATHVLSPSMLRILLKPYAPAVFRPLSAYSCTTPSYTA
jgi:hypothetical protein